MPAMFMHFQRLPRITLTKSASGCCLPSRNRSRGAPRGTAGRETPENSSTPPSMRPALSKVALTHEVTLRHRKYPSKLSRHARVRPPGSSPRISTRCKKYLHRLRAEDVESHATPAWITRRKNRDRKSTRLNSSHVA